jgi:hypothetical protein
MEGDVPPDSHDASVRVPASGADRRSELDFDGFMLIMQGHAAFQLLWAGTQLGLFPLLSRHPGAKAHEIGAALHLKPRPTSVLLTGLTALRLIHKEDGGYRNGPIAQRFLIPGVRDCMVDILGWQRHIVYPGAMDLVDALRGDTNVGLRHFPGQGETLYARIAETPSLEKIFHDAMSAISNSANEMLAERMDLSGVRHLVDAGGGDGTNAIRLARQHPGLRVTVFDSPTVCRLAEQNIERSGLSGRIAVFPGNLFDDPFPSHVDCVLFAHMMTIWSLETDTGLLRRAYEALPDTGRVVIFNMMGWDDEEGPISTALGSVYFLTIATGEGRLHSWREYEACLAAAGFAGTERIELPRDHGILIGRKSRA